MKNSAILFFLFIFSLSAVDAQTPKPSPRRSPKPVKTAAVRLGSEAEEFEKARIAVDPLKRVAALQEFIKNFPESAEIERAQSLLATARAELGIIRLQAKDIKGGLEFYRLAVAESPAPVSEEIFSKVFLGLPVSLYTLNERAAAFDIAKLIEEKIGNNAAQILDLARFYMNVEYGTEAIRLAQKAVEIAPASAAAYQTLADANRLNFRLEDAAAAYARAAELDQQQAATSRLSLAEMKRALGKTDEAIALYREILEKEPESKPAQAGLALALFDSGKRTEAEAEMKKALEIDPLNSRLLAGAAYWYAARGFNEQAIETAQKAIAFEPRNVWAYIAQARALTAQNKPLEAEKVLLAARQFSDFPTLDYELASVRLAAGLYREAAETLRRSFKVNPDGTVETYLGNRILADAASFTELLSLERRVALFETNPADSEENTRRLKALLEFNQKLEAKEATEEELALAAEQFAVGTDNMRLHRQLFAASRLLQKKTALPKVIELMQSAISGVDSALNVPNPSSAVLADEIYERRQYALSQNLVIVVPEIPRQTLSAILRGRIEDTAALALLQQNNTAQSIVRLKRALSVLPEKSAWSRASYWNLGEALMADGKEKEALQAYIKSYDMEFPNAERRNFIENLYVKVNGSTDGLDELVGVKAETTLATTENKNAPVNTDNVRPEPTPERRPEIVPAAKTEETQQTTEVKTEPTPAQMETVPAVVPEKSPAVTPSPVAVETTEQVKPAETNPEDAKTEEIKPEETKTVEIKPEEVKTEENTPEEVKTEPTPNPSPASETPGVQPAPTEIKTDEVNPEESKPEDQKPEEIKPEEIKPTETKPETKPEPTPAPSPQNVAVIVTDNLTPNRTPAKVSESKTENKPNDPASVQRSIFEPVVISVGKPDKPSTEKTDRKPVEENKTDAKTVETPVEEKPSAQTPTESVPIQNVSAEVKPAEPEEKTEEKPTEKEVKNPLVVVTDTLKPANETSEKTAEKQSQTQAEQERDEKLLSGERRPRIIITENTGAKTVTEEITTCKLSINPDSLSLLNNGGRLAVNVGFDGEDGDFRQIRAVSSSSADLEVRLDPEVGASGNRAVFIVKSLNKKTGIFTVTFAAPCGKKEILVRVR